LCVVHRINANNDTSSLLLGSKPPTGLTPACANLFNAFLTRVGTAGERPLTRRPPFSNGPPNFSYKSRYAANWSYYPCVNFCTPRAFDVTESGVLTGHGRNITWTKAPTTKIIWKALPNCLIFYFFKAFLFSCL
jgi:hypothetical protein